MKSADLDAFARLLDGDLPEGEATAEARVLSSFARALESSASQPRMESKAELRMALVEAARQQASAPSFLSRLRQGYDETTARWRYSMRLAAASGATAMALSSGGVALASARAMPSDLFYGVKLVYEDVRVALIGDPVARAEQLLAYAEQRIVEAEMSAADGDMMAAQRALIEADNSGRSAAGYIIRASQDRGDPTLLAILDDFAAEHRKRINALLPLLSGEALAAAEDALVGLRRIHQRVAVLSGPCTECDSRAAAVGGAGGRGSGDEGADIAAADPDFDFATIPPADEPFAPCPCSGATTVDTRVDDDAKDKAKRKKRGAQSATGAQEPAAAGETAGDSGDESGNDGGGGDAGDEPADDGGDDGPLPDAPEQLPDEVEKPVNDTTDVIEDILENPPTELPDLPNDPSSLLP